MRRSVANKLLATNRKEPDIAELFRRAKSVIIPVQETELDGEALSKNGYCFCL
jgi:hypothetical protein